MKGGCSVMVVMFMSRDLCSHVLCRVPHLVNGIVVFLESRLFSSLAKFLQNRTPLNHKITLYFYGNIVFPDQAECSYGKRKCFAAFSLRTN